MTIMAQKKKTTEVESKTTSKNNNLSEYLDRFQEIEIYLRLLQEPRLIASVLHQSPIGSANAIERIEKEIKMFIEHKFQVLTGLSVETGTSTLNKDEMTALKLLAAKVMPKTELVHSSQALQESMSLKDPEEPLYVPQPEAKVWSGKAKESKDDDLVSVKTLNGEQRLKKNRKLAENPENVVKATEIPKVDGPTDRMKRSAPQGAQPKARATPQEEMAIAAMQAQQTSKMMDQMMLEQGLPGLSGQTF